MKPPAPRLVVIVEDSDTCAVTLQIALETLPGVELQFASNAADAWRLVDNTAMPVAAVITDLRLPGTSGLELLAWLRADRRFQDLPVLIVSGDSDPGLPGAALSLGASCLFTKPYSPAEVRKKVEQLIG